MSNKRSQQNRLKKRAKNKKRRQSKRRLNIKHGKRVNKQERPAWTEADFARDARNLVGRGAPHVPEEELSKMTAEELSKKISSITGERDV